MKEDLVSHTFEAHSQGPIHSMCYGMADLMDKQFGKLGLIITGGADGNIQIWDPLRKQNAPNFVFFVYLCQI